VLIAASPTGGDNGLTWRPFNGVLPSPLLPKVACINRFDATHLSAVLSYENQAGQSVTVPLGNGNHLSLSGAVSPPTSFLPGVQNSVFVVPFSSSVASSSLSRSAKMVFDVGFFDLIIADESHRSVYKKFRTIFQHFDALEVGLTATPVRFIERNTYGLFGCEDRDPTSHFSFEDAINAKPSFLVPFCVMAVSTQFSRSGFRYTQMSPEQQTQLEDQEPLAEQRVVYAQAALTHGWSRNVLVHHIEARTVERQGKALNSASGNCRSRCRTWRGRP